MVDDAGPNEPDGSSTAPTDGSCGTATGDAVPADEATDGAAAGEADPDRNGEHGIQPETATQLSLTELVIVYLKGTAMGAADSVPGVSGGTIALITGIYERLLLALTEFDPRVLGYLPRLHRPAGRAQFWGELRAMDLPFLSALGLGVMSALVVLSSLVHTALTEFPALTYAFFFGLILASAIILYRDLRIRTARQAGAAIGGFGLAFLLSGISSAGLIPTSLPSIFLAGALAITATVLPGISGAFILLLLGQYEYLTGVLKRGVGGIIDLPKSGVTPGLIENGTVVLTFGGGAIIGLFSMAYTIRWALANYRAATLAFLVSLMVGSLRLPAIEVGAAIGAWSPAPVVGVGGAAVLGAGAVLLLDFFTADLDYDATG